MPKTSRSIHNNKLIEYNKRALKKLYYQDCSAKLHQTLKEQQKTLKKNPDNLTKFQDEQEIGREAS